MYYYDDIKTLVNNDTVFVGDIEKIEFNKAKNLNEADEYSIVWIKNSGEDALRQILKTRARVIVCTNNIELDNNITDGKCLILTNNPKYVYATIVNFLFVTKEQIGIHQSAIIDKNAKIGKNVCIGAYSIIGSCVIGDNSIIQENVIIRDCVRIGNKVFIKSGAIIGNPGFGFVKNEKSEWGKFPQIGNVIIEDNVEIGSNVCIDRGALSTTIISSGTKIDNLTQIAHNVKIGKNCIIAGNVSIAGSCNIGDNVWIGPSATINNGLTIGSNSFISLGSVIINNVPPNSDVIGYPAESKELFVRKRLALVKLIKRK